MHPPYARPITSKCNFLRLSLPCESGGGGDRTAEGQRQSSIHFASVANFIYFCGDSRSKELRFRHSVFVSL